MTHILLVEDNPLDAELMQRTFLEMREWPTRITWIDDSEKALSFLQSMEHVGVTEPPALVLMDVNMPRHGGLDVLAAYRRSETAVDIPVFLLSSSPAEDIRALAADRGLRLNGCFEKPSTLQGFQAIIRAIQELFDESETRHAIEFSGYAT